MSQHYLLETVPSAQAKAKFRELLDGVAHDHRALLIDRYGRDPVALLEPAAIVALVDERFETEVIVEPDEVSVTLPQVGLIGAGATLDAAIDDTLEKLRVYARRYMDNRAFYARTDRAREYKLLAKFMFTPTEKQRALLLEDASSEPEAAAARA